MYIEVNKSCRITESDVKMEKQTYTSTENGILKHPETIERSL